MYIETGYTRSNQVINNLNVSGHSGYDFDVRVNDQYQFKINHVNEDAVKRTGTGYGGYGFSQTIPNRFVIDRTYTVGPSGDFTDLRTAIQYVIEYWSPVYNG
jgi:hypothetical protein